jgi:hypothetical protein
MQVDAEKVNKSRAVTDDMAITSSCICNPIFVTPGMTRFMKRVVSGCFRISASARTGPCG